MIFDFFQKFLAKTNEVNGKNIHIFNYEDDLWDGNENAIKVTLKNVILATITK